MAIFVPRRNQPEQEPVPPSVEWAGSATEYQISYDQHRFGSWRDYRNRFTLDEPVEESNTNHMNIHDYFIDQDWSQMRHRLGLVMNPLLKEVSVQFTGTPYSFNEGDVSFSSISGHKDTISISLGGKIKDEKGTHVAASDWNGLYLKYTLNNGITFFSTDLIDQAPDVQNGDQFTRRVKIYEAWMEGDIVVTGTDHLVPEFFLKTAEHIRKIKEDDIIIVSENRTYRVGKYDGTKTTLLSPMIFFASNYPIFKKILEGYAEQKNLKMIIEHLKSTSRGALHNAEREARESYQRYLRAMKALAARSKGEEQLAITLVSQAREAVEEDSQVLCTYFSDGKLEAVVGPIMTNPETTDGKIINYGYYRLVIEDHIAYNFCTNWGDQGNHPNISHNICMGAYGSEAYAEFIRDGKYKEALSYFIYRLSNPTNEGFNSFDASFSPSVSAFSVVLKEIQETGRFNAFFTVTKNTEVSTSPRRQKGRRTQEVVANISDTVVENENGDDEEEF